MKNSVEFKQFYYVFCELIGEEYITLNPFSDPFYTQRNKYKVGSFLSVIEGILPFMLALEPSESPKEFISNYFELQIGKDELVSTLGSHEQANELFVEFMKNCIALEESEISKLTAYSHFIEMCLNPEKGGEHCNLDSFCKFTSMIGDTLAAREKAMILPEYLSDTKISSAEQLFDLLSHGTVEQKTKLNHYKTAKKELSKYKESKGVSDREIDCALKMTEGYVKQRSKELKGEFLHCYPISSFTEIISASLQSILESKRIIKKCALCERVFVPMRSSAEFCDKQSLKDMGKTCKQYRRHVKEMERQAKNLCMRIYKSRKVSLENRNNPDGDFANIFEKFESTCNDYFTELHENQNNDAVRLDAENRFIEFLNATYLRKGKTEYTPREYKPREYKPRKKK